MIRFSPRSYRVIFFLMTVIFAEKSFAQYVSHAFWRAAPVFDWDFTSLTSLPSQLTFSRSSIATYYNSSGVLTTAASGGLRFDYDPSTLTKKGLLLEASVTNYVKYGSALTNSTGWGTYNATVNTTAATNSPDGTADAFILNDGTASNIQHNLGTNGAIPYTANSVVTGSWFVKNNTRRYVAVGMQDAVVSNDGIDCIFDLTAGTNTAKDTYGTTGGNPTCSIQSVGNGWYRLATTGIPSTTRSSIQLFIALSSGGAAGSDTYTGSSKTIYVYGPQVETGSTLTSYIPTTAGATVTRAADQLTFNTMSWFNATAGTLFAQFINVSSENAQTYRVFGFFNTNVAGTFAQNEIALADSGTTNRSDVTSGGAAQFSPAGTLNAAGSVNKMAMSYLNANFAYSLNGGTPVTQSSGSLPTAAAYGYICSQPDGNARSRWLQKIRYYNIRLTGTQLQGL